MMSDKARGQLLVRLSRAEHALRSIKSLIYKQINGVVIDPHLYLEQVKKGLGEDDDSL